MSDTDPRITPTYIEQLVAAKFHEENITSACLGEAMICKLLVEKYTRVEAKLVKGYVKLHNTYWGHFWLTIDSCVIDPASRTWFLSLPRELKHLFKYRELSVQKPDGCTCADANNFNAVQQHCFDQCENGRFWENLSDVAGSEVMNKFQQVYHALQSKLEIVAATKENTLS